MIDLVKKMGIQRGEMSGPLQRYVDKIRGIEPVSSHVRRWTIDNQVAEVRFGTENDLRISHSISKPPDALDSLKTNHDLPGNLRFAACGREVSLVADTQLDGATHLMHSFAELEAGMLFAIGETSRMNRGTTLDPKAVSTAINTCRWPDEYTVQRATGWEFRPRHRGDVTPVQAVIDGESLRIGRTVVCHVHEPHCFNAICAQALRFNDHLRHARLAFSEGKIVAESRLHSGQLDQSWIEMAAGAVAVASRHAEHVLGILAENREVAEVYSDVFLADRA